MYSSSINLDMDIHDIYTKKSEWYSQLFKVNHCNLMWSNHEFNCFMSLVIDTGGVLQVLLSLKILFQNLIRQLPL